jgi:hypothetical protein
MSPSEIAERDHTDYCNGKDWFASRPQTGGRSNRASAVIARDLR